MCKLSFFTKVILDIPRIIAIMLTKYQRYNILINFGIVVFEECNFMTSFSQILKFLFISHCTVHKI